MAAAVALWIDQLLNGAIAELAKQTKFYKIAMITILVLMIPWMISGWYAVRKESRRLMIVFLILTFLYVAGFCSMFASDTFRWTYITWVFFGMIETIAAALALTVLVLGIVCRLNFGKGLKECLNSLEELTDKDAYEDDEFAPNSFTNDAQHLEKVDPESIVPHFVEVDLQRQGSNSSQNSVSSFGSKKSGHVARSDSQSSQAGKKRWAIDDDL